LVSADVSISQLNQIVGKSLATAAKEAVTVQDQRLSFVRDVFRDLGCVGDIQGRCRTGLSWATLVEGDQARVIASN